MKVKYYLGYIFAMVCGLATIGSVFLPLNITYIAKEYTLGQSLFNAIINFSVADMSLKIISVIYLFAVILSLVLVLYSLVALIFVLRGKRFRINLVVIRIISCLAFALVIAMFIYLGVKLSTIETPYYNFLGMGPALAVIGNMFLLQSLFMVQKPFKEKKKEVNKAN